MREFTRYVSMMLLIILFSPKQVRAYDMDCAILLCMAGGFPASDVCSAAYTTMIWRITPVPALPPFGTCTYAAVPVDQGGPGGEEVLDVSTPDYDWLDKTRIYWFWGHSYQTRDGERRWTWRIQACNQENTFCHLIISVADSDIRWPEQFLSQNKQMIPYPTDADLSAFTNRALLMEYGDYDGNLDHSGWITY